MKYVQGYTQKGMKGENEGGGGGGGGGERIFFNANICNVFKGKS